MIAHCDYYRTLPAEDPPAAVTTSTWTFTNGPRADTSTCTTSWGWSGDWYYVSPDPVQEEPIILPKKQNRNIFDDRQNIYKSEKPIVNNIPRKRIHNRFGRVCVT